jgi:hypothetical protein
MVGRQKLSGKQEKIQFKVCISLCKNIMPNTDHLKRGAYFSLSQELSDLGVSPRYVGDVWKKHKENILDPLNKDLYVSIATQGIWSLSKDFCSGTSFTCEGSSIPFSQEFKDPFLQDRVSINNHPSCIEVGAPKVVKEQYKAHIDAKEHIGLCYLLS